MRDEDHKFRWGRWVVLALGILLSAYLASPLIVLHEMASAVENKNAAALTERMDFPALKRSFTRQITQEYRKLTGKKLPLNALARRVAISVADPVVARMMTVRALLDLLGKGKAGENTSLPAERAPFASGSLGNLWQVWLDSDYLGTDFFVYLPPKTSREEQFRVHLRLKDWRWQMVGLDLPDDLKEHLARELIKLSQEHSP